MIHIIDKRTKLTLFIAALFAAFYFVDYVFSLAEKDPLTVEQVGEDSQRFVKVGGLFVFDRKVCTTKDLKVTVHREYHHIESGKKFMLSGIRYVAYAKDSCYETQFTAVVPAGIPTGEYEYRPILIYDVNNRKTIAKAAPVVRINVL